MSARPPEEVMDDLLHEVNSKCSSLKSAAALLKKSPPAEKAELLALMVQQAQELAQYLLECAREPKIR